MPSDFIYRVTVKTTFDGQARPLGGPCWNFIVAYCGPSLRDARVAYLREEQMDQEVDGNPVRRTVIEMFLAEPDAIDERVRIAYVNCVA